MCVFSSVHAGAHEGQKRELDPGAGVTNISELPNMRAGSWTPVFAIQQQETQQLSGLFRTRNAVENVSHLAVVTVTATYKPVYPKESPQTQICGDMENQVSQSDLLTWC